MIFNRRFRATTRAILLSNASETISRFVSRKALAAGRGIPAASALPLTSGVRSRRYREVIALAFLTLLAVILTSSALAEDVESKQTPAITATAKNPGTKRALILCGLPGDAAHHTLYSETVTKLHEGVSQRLGFSDVQVLFGDEKEDSDADVIKSAGQATREELEQRVAALRTKLQPNDTLWVIVVGHSHYDGKHSWLNLPGPDIQQFDFAKLFEGLTAAQQVFFLTTPTSGFYIKPLAAKGRVVITATQTDWETNETEYPHELARVLSAPPDAKEFDIDEDGTISLFDLYVTVARDLAQSYLDGEFLATEHPLLDDNGDGRGTELQIDYLTVEQGGRMRPNKPQTITLKPTSDGSLSKSIRLMFRLADSAGPASKETP